LLSRCEEKEPAKQSQLNSAKPLSPKTYALLANGGTRSGCRRENMKLVLRLKDRPLSPHFSEQKWEESGGILQPRRLQDDNEFYVYDLIERPP
jgi:hypothetical protein